MMQIKNIQTRRGIYRLDGKSHVYKVPPKEIDRYLPMSRFDEVTVVDSPERGGR
jgi:hypothetical protein